MNGNTKRAARAKRAVVALLLALAVLAGRVDPTAHDVDPGRPAVERRHR